MFEMRENFFFFEWVRRIFEQGLTKLMVLTKLMALMKLMGLEKLIDGSDEID